MRATFFNSEGAKTNDSLGPPDVRPPGYAPGQVPDALWSTNQIEIKYLAQGYKHAGRSGARAHNIDGLVIMGPALFR